MDSGDSNGHHCRHGGAKVFRRSLGSYHDGHLAVTEEANVTFPSVPSTIFANSFQ